MRNGVREQFMRNIRVFSGRANASAIASVILYLVARKNIFLVRLYCDETCDRLRLFKTPAAPRELSTAAISALNMRPRRNPRYARNVIIVNYMYTPPC